MTSAFTRISENTLFSLLIAVFVGSIVVSAAADRTAPLSSPSSAMARVATGNGNS